MTDQPEFIYDQVVYPNYIHSQTHPDRLAMMAKFFGVNPGNIENCRVLELGCGTGCGLLSFAYDLPESEFIGIDLSEKQIEYGKRAVEGAGLKNLSLRQRNIMDLSRAELGEFDYIIAHGVYSWVPDFVREQILKICGEMLTEQGVAFISYNTYPGGHYRQMVREMMLFHSKNLDTPEEKVKQSMGLLQFVTNAAQEKKVHHGVLEKEFKHLAKGNFENILHDDLAEVNRPFYFYEFVEQAEKHDLQFVTEVEYFNAMFHSREVLEVLENITGGDVIAVEQYLDFIKGRRFRQTLLCRKELNISPLHDPKVLRQVRLSTSLRPESEKPELASDKHEKFLGKDAEKIEINHPLSKAALYHLGQIWMRTLTFDELIAASADLLEAESGKKAEITNEDEKILSDILFHVFCSDLLQMNIHEPVYAPEVSEKPMASPLARWQAEHSDLINTLRCVGLKIEDPLGRELIKLLDGTRNREQLLESMTEFINSDRLKQPREIKDKLIQELPSQLDKSLNDFARMALLLS